MLPWPELVTTLSASATVLWPVIQNLSTKSAEKFAEDFLKDALKNVLLPGDTSNEKFAMALSKALAGGLAAFIQNAEDELRDAGCDDSALVTYTCGFADLLRTSKAKAQLGAAFIGSTPDALTFERLWEELHPTPPSLPTEFSWKRVLGRYQRTVVTLCERTPELRDQLSVRKNAETADALAALRPYTPGWDLDGYRRSLRKTHSDLKLHQLGAEAQLKTPIGLQKVFIEQYIRDQSSLPAAFYRLPIEVREKLAKEENVEFPEFDSALVEHIRSALKTSISSGAIEFVTDPLALHCVIIGDPGSGKSTLLQKLALDWVDTPLADAGPVPLLVELRRYAEERKTNAAVTDFCTFLHHGCAERFQFDATAVRDALTEGRASLFLDGFDEVFDPQLRKEIIHIIARAIEVWPRARIVLSTRPYGYEPAELERLGFRHGSLQPLEKTQVTTFLNRWHLALPDENRAVLQTRLATQLEAQPRLGELSGNPLLLTMMALLNRTEPLPERRAALYERCIALLLHQWETVVHGLPSGPRTGPYAGDNLQLGLDEKRALLRTVAHRMQTSGAGLSGNLIKARDLVLTLTDALPAWIEDAHRERVAQELVEQLEGRNYILASLGNHRFGFVHRTFLEFCCADWFLYRLTQRGDLTNEEFFAEAFLPNWQDDRWREILLLLASQLEAPRLRVVLEGLLAQSTSSHGKAYTHLFLAAYCLAEARSSEGLEEIRKRLWTELAALVDLPLVDEAKGEWDKENKPISNIRYKAISAASVAWNGRRMLREWLEALEENHIRSVARCTALRSLGRNWSGDDQVCNLLKYRAIHDQDSGVRGTALNVLAQNWGTEPWVQPFIENCTSDDQDPSLRCIGYTVMGAHWAHKPGVRAFLESGATEDPDAFVRLVAITNLVETWPDQATRELIERRVAEEPDGLVRVSILDALVEKWPKDEPMRNLVKARAVEEPRAEFRKPAIEKLTKEWPEDVETRAFVQLRTTEDEDQSIREWCLRWLSNNSTKPM